MRSKLFVPGSRPELFSKALASAADALSFDLEDSVTLDRKAEARAALQRYFSGLPFSACGKTVIVRINAVDTGLTEADIAAVAQPGVNVINLPKPSSVDEVRQVADLIQQAEKRNGVAQPMGILLNVESPFALRHADALALAHPRVMGLQVGLGDLFEPLGISRQEPVAIHNTLFSIRMSAARAGIAAYDGAFADIQNTDGYRQEAALAYRLGYAGKTCIHPSQIAIANAVFTPTSDQIRDALDVLDATAKAESTGTGAYVVNGKMIDVPFVLRARRVVEDARRFGLIEPSPRV